MLKSYTIRQKNEEDKFVISNLVDDIKINGLIDPIFIRIHKNGNIVIKDGKHRFLALKKLGCKKVPITMVPL